MRSFRVATDRLEMQVYESGPEDGVPVVLLHGNLSTGRFYEHLFDDAPERYRLIAPDMRGFGNGGVAADGTPHYDDFAGSGGGTANPDFVERLRDGDRTSVGELAPRNVL